MIEDRDVNPNTVVFKIFPRGIQKLKIAYLSTGNGIGLELFEFMDPRIEPGRESSFDTGRDFRRGGIFHFAITAPDIDVVCEKAVENGGQMVGERVQVYGHDGAYIQDPWGNAIEVISISFEQLLCNRPEGSLVND